MYYLLFTIKAPKSSHVMAVAGERCTSETYFKTCEGFGRLNGVAVCGVRPGESGVISRKGRVPPRLPARRGAAGLGTTASPEKTSAQHRHGFKTSYKSKTYI